MFICQQVKGQAVTATEEITSICDVNLCIKTAKNFLTGA